MKFRHQSRTVTMLKINEKYCSIIQIYIFSISMHTQNLIKIHKLIHKILSINKILTSIKVGWLCWGLTSQSTIFQSCRDGAIASWVINQYFRGVKCIAQGHNTAAVGLEPRTSRSGVRHSTTEPPRSPTSIKDHNFVKNWPKIICIRHNTDLAYINAYTNFYQSSSICSEDIEEKHIFTKIKGHNPVVYKRI